jgi:hypothetical protein
MSDEKVSARVSVLHAAILLPSFSIERVARFTGLAPCDVRRVLDEAVDSIERVPPSANVYTLPALFRLIEPMRQAVCVEVVQGMARTADARKPDPQAILRTIEVVLDAAQSSVEEAHCQTIEDFSAVDWLTRAREQVTLACRLLRLVPSSPERTPLNSRAQALLASLDRLSRSGEFRQSPVGP